MNDRILETLRCPACVRVKPTRLVRRGSVLSCTDADCRASYPVIDGIPVLLTRSGDFHRILPPPGTPPDA